MYACNVIAGLHLSVYVYKGKVDSWLIQLQGEKTNVSVRANRITKMLYAAFNAFCIEGKIKLKKNRRFV